ncbi:MAG TPA: hypothetical protein GXX40_09550 [Firmicutes bacterium]|nr:hypothetical protein [Bacillota bacterium]
MFDEKGSAFIVSVIVLGLLAAVVTAAMATESALKTVDAAIGESRNALDLARGVAQEMLRALYLNQFDVARAGTINHSDPAKGWTAQGWAETRDGETVAAIGKATVADATYTVTIVVKPVHSPISDGVLITPEDISLDARGNGGLSAFGTVYCASFTPHGYFDGKPETKLSSIAPEDMPKVDVKPFEEVERTLTFRNIQGPYIVSGNERWDSHTRVMGNAIILKHAKLTVPQGVWGVVEGDLIFTGTSEPPVNLVVDGVLLVRGNVAGGSSQNYKAAVDGNGVIVATGSVEGIQLQGHTPNGLKIFSLGDDNSKVSIQIDASAGGKPNLPKSLFVYASGPVTLGFRGRKAKLFQLQPGLVISHKHIDVQLRNGNPSVEIHSGQFDFGPIQLPASFRGTDKGYVIIDWQEVRNPQ